ncbi:MAG: AbrB/MazE/SpoVT family DNA-binding domain-containing protein [Actinobacteria bacterium]|nr:AbrB/MazE/SpoVT family DNA-binding domain-containing protein [Actinomycetota bacterium]
MSSSIGRWGNSAAVRLPAVVLQQAGLALNDQIDIRVSSGKVTLQAKPKQDLSLDQLLDLITKENLHTEVDFGRPVGKELI